ncbi:Uncharacterised protein [Candidatus Tiddalikarchaeum anstoanum]|nr:Uncharacterised protein [Candidatus Tiddalikarchaeum anstoanum]
MELSRFVKTLFIRSGIPIRVDWNICDLPDTERLILLGFYESAVSSNVLHSQLKEIRYDNFVFIPLEEKITYFPNLEMPLSFRQYFDKISTEGSTINLEKKEYSIQIAYVPSFGFKNRVIIKEGVDEKKVNDELDCVIPFIEEKYNNLFIPIKSDILCLGLFSNEVQYCFGKVYLRNVLMELFKKFGADFFTDSSLLKSGCSKQLIKYDSVKDELENINNWFVNKVKEMPYDQSFDDAVKMIRFEKFVKKSMTNLSNILKP